MSRGELNINRWLEAHSDRNAGLTTLPRSLVLADVAGDGDYRLVLTDLNMEDCKSRLKMYKGTTLSSDQPLPDTACGIISFYTDALEPRIPAVAVACGSELLFYKNNKPYFKFSLPPIPVSALEKDVWRRLQQHSDRDIQKAIEDLKNISYSSLSARSQHLLSLPTEKMEDFVGKFVDTEPVKVSTITCLTTLNRNSHEKYSAACPVVATEAGHVYILDPQVFGIMHQANVCSTKSSPYLMTTTGLFDVEFRIIVACRENYVCVLRRDWLEGKMIFQTTAHIVDLLVIPGDNLIVVATSDKMLHCYTKRGNRLWSSTMVNYITSLCLVPLNHLSTHLVAVGLKGGFIHLYKRRNAVDHFAIPDTPSAITFGQLGQEEHTMVIITCGGTIIFKILKRTADFNLSGQDGNSTPLYQNKPLPIPKRSKLFIEQSMREKENPVDMHQSFQQDLIRLRLLAARATVQNLSVQSGLGNEKEQVKLSAQVLGLGPKFTLILKMENMNAEKPLIGLLVTFHANTSLYRLSSYLIKLPLIPPGLSYKCELKVTEVNPEQQSGLEENTSTSKRVIRVFVIRENQKQPVLAATIDMPPIDTTIYNAV